MTGLSCAAIGAFIFSATLPVAINIGSIVDRQAFIVVLLHLEHQFTVFNIDVVFQEA